MKINVATEFSKFPVGRFPQDGDFNGQRFRQSFLETPFRASNDETVIVDFTGVYGWGSSFLEEAFGGLVRVLKLSGEQISRRIQIISSDLSLEHEIREYILKVQP